MAEKRRLIWVLYPSYLLIILISLIAVTWYASVSIRNFFLSQTESDLESRARLFENQVLPYLYPVNEEKIDLLCKMAGRISFTRLTVILPSGKVVGDSEADPGEMDNHADRPEVLEALRTGQGVFTRFSRTLDKNFMYVGIPVKGKDGLKGVIRTSIPVDVIDNEIIRIQRRIIYVGVIIALLGAVISLFISRRISKPIEALKESADYFVKGDFGHRIPASMIVEINGLHEAIRGMAREMHQRINTIIRQRTEIEAILSSMVEGVIAIDKEDIIISMNRSAARMLGSDFSTAKGRSVQEAVRNSAFQAFVKEALSSPSPVEKEIELSLSGDLVVNGHGTPLRDEAGNKIGALIVLNDITRLKKLENIRTEFVANVSHEIKTPITAIKGFVETLEDGRVKDEDDKKRFLGIISNHVNRLESIIEDLLKLSRIEKDADTEEIRLTNEEIEGVIKNAVQVCIPGAGVKGIKIVLDCAEGLTARINALLLEQALVNLIDNAVKYSDENSKVTIKSYGDEKEVFIDVIDQGRGIEKEHLPRLFERFYRVDKARSRRLGGTGLGLSIVKHIVQAQGGKVTVKSSPGNGSTFTIRLLKPAL